MLTLLAFAFGALHLRADHAGARAQVYLFKPLTVLAIITLAASGPPGFYRDAVLAGLACSLAGDVFLMLPGDRLRAGLTSFLLAHLCYIAAFAREVTVFPALTLLPFVLYGLVLQLWLGPHLGRLRWPALAYTGAILAMAWAATERWLQTGAPGSGMAFAGALAFVVSDTLLAINRFRRRHRLGQALVLTSYYLAQWSIAYSVVAAGFV